MDILMTVWSYFATNILQQPAFMIGLIVMVGYILLGKPWYDTLGGTLKAIVGYLILTVGSGGLTNNFRPVLVDVYKRQVIAGGGSDAERICREKTCKVCRQCTGLAGGHPDEL